MSLKLLKQSVDIIQEESRKKDSKKSGKKKTGQDTTNSRLHTFKDHKKTTQPLSCFLNESKSKKSEENIKKLLALSMNTISSKDAEKIVQRAHKGRYVKKPLPVVEQESIFTEEDFQKFEEEYFKS